MRLAISNIAWNIEEDPEIVRLLQKHQIDAIDIAPTKYFPNPKTPNTRDIKHIKNWWEDHGVEITGMQSLLFGKPNLNIFAGKKDQNKILEYLQGIFRIGEILGAKRLVFGSPKNRDRSLLTDSQAFDSAVFFFRKLGNLAQENGLVVNLEPNPIQYGSNFMITTEETANVVNAVNHGSIKMQFDTGSIAISNESADNILKRYSDLIGHIHISEPNLIPLGDGATDHAVFAKALKRFLPNHFLVIEMIATKTEAHINSIERAIIHANRNYLDISDTTLQANDG